MHVWSDLHILLPTGCQLILLYWRVASQDRTDIVAFGANVGLPGSLTGGMYQLASSCRAGDLHQSDQFIVGQVIVEIVST
ncbi:MAG TPA: hypothetical protein VGF67_21325 [Ktedonobacteraceae bacterium]